MIMPREARAIAQEVKDKQQADKVQAQLKVVSHKIEHAAANGNFGLVYNDLELGTIETLKAQGYGCVYHDCSDSLRDSYWEITF